MINILVSNVVASASNLSVLTAGMVKGRSVKFEFSSDWDALNKTAVFTNGIETRIVPEYKWVDGCIADIPPEVLAVPHYPVKCGVYGMSESGEQVIPTLWVDIGRVFPSASPGEYQESVPPTPNTWDDLQNQIGVLSKLNTEEKSNLVNAINEALAKGVNPQEVWGIVDKYLKENPPKDGVDGKDGKDGVDGYTPQREIDYWTPTDIAEIKIYIDNAILNGEW